MGLVVMGCAANTDVPVDSTTVDETEEASDSLSSRRLIGTYARVVDSIDGCSVVSRLELGAGGRFKAKFDDSAVPGRPSAFMCAAVVAETRAGTWSATNRGRITLRAGRSVVAVASGNGNKVQFASSAGSAFHFAGTLERLGDDQCLDSRDCLDGEQCVLPFLNPCAPGETCSRPGRLIGFCAATPEPIDSGILSPPDAGGYPDAEPPVDAGPAPDAGDVACGPTLLCGPGYECRSYGLGAPCRVGEECASIAYLCVATGGGGSADAGSGGGSTDASVVVVDPLAVAAAE